MPWYIWFIIGLFMGAIIGFFVAALCQAARRGDEMLEQQHEKDIQELY